MAIQTLSTIKNWFKTNSKPTQAQFWDTWDSFRHKNEKISVEDLNGIDELLQNKVERGVFDNHLADPNAHAESFSKKLDKGGYNGTGKNLDDRITAIETPDRVLKFGVLTLSGLNLTITSNAFAWVVNKLQFLTPGSYAKTLTAATSGMYRTDIVVGNQSGTYEVITGFEAATGSAAVEPPPPAGTIKLGFITLLGNAVVNSGSTPTIEKATIIDADRIVIDDSETSFAKKSVKFLNFKTALKAYFDTIYQSFMGIVTVTGTTYQLLLTDNGKKIMCTNTTAVAFTIPTNAVVALPIGARIKVTQQGDGNITFATTGLTIVSSSPLYTIKGQTVTLEKTAINTWTIEGNNLNGEIRLAAYPSTRNDGQISSNRVLSTDVNGNLKLYTIATAPAPYIDIVIPDSTLPNTTGNFELYGSFFTPTMTVLFTGQILNYITFHSSNWITVNVTTGVTEGLFNITLDNGISKTFVNAYQIVLGTVFKPLTSDWTLIEPVNVDNDNVYTQTHNSLGYAEWNKQFDYTKNFSIRFKRNLTPLGAYQNRLGVPLFILQKVSNSGNLFWSGFAGGTSFSSLADGSLGNYENDNGATYEYRWVSGIMYAYVNKVLFKTFTQTFTENLKLKIRVDIYDITSIKYIELAT